MPEQMSVRNSQIEAECVSIRENRGADAGQEQAPRHIAPTASNRQGKRDGRVGNDGRHGVYASQRQSQRREPAAPGV